MAAPFKCDEKVSIERKTGAVDPDSGVELDTWEVLYERYWANVQDILPSRQEATNNGMRIDAMRSRLRMQGAGGANTEMRAILHSRGDRIAQIISGPALLDDRVHFEFIIEGFKHG